MTHWFYDSINDRFQFESYCGHDWSYDPKNNFFVEDWMDWEGNIRVLTHKRLPPLFRPAFEYLRNEVLNSIYP